MIEAASMLLDQCGTYRLEDYIAMFTLAKRGKLHGEFYQSVDITTISKIEQAYDEYSVAMVDKAQHDAYREQEKAWRDAAKNAPPPAEGERTFGEALEMLERMKAEISEEDDRAIREYWEKRQEQEQRVAEFAAQHGLDVDQIRKDFQRDQQSKIRKP